MPYCAVLECKNDSRTKNVSNGGISYHRFPMDPNRKEKWINATGRQSWFPAKTSTICSDHFKDADFLVKSGKKYLADTAVPKQKIIYFQSNESGAGPSSKISALPMQKDALDTNASPTSAASTPRKNRLKGVKRWKESKIKRQNLIIRKLKANNSRLKRKVNKIEDILKVLEEKFSIVDENITNLKNTNEKDVNELHKPNENTPKKKKLLKSLNQAKETVIKQRKQIKILRERNRRSIVKIHALENQASAHRKFYTVGTQTADSEVNERNNKPSLSIGTQTDFTASFIGAAFEIDSNNAVSYPSTSGRTVSFCINCRQTVKEPENLDAYNVRVPSTNEIKIDTSQGDSSQSCDEPATPESDGIPIKLEIIDETLCDTGESRKRKTGDNIDNDQLRTELNKNEKKKRKPCRPLIQFLSDFSEYVDSVPSRVDSNTFDSTESPDRKCEMVPQTLVIKEEESVPLTSMIIKEEPGSNDEV